MVFVSHRMDEILDISDRVYVMSDGRIVADRDKAKVNVDELYELMVGKQRVIEGVQAAPPSEEELVKAMV